MQDNTKSQKPRQRAPGKMSSPTLRQGQQLTWAKVATGAPGAPAKATSTQPARQGSESSLPKRPSADTVNSKRVFLRLPDDATQREQHPMIIVKTINSCLPENKGVATATHVRTGFALTLKPGTRPQEMVESRERIRSRLGSGHVELDERWTVVKIRNLERKINEVTDQGTMTLREVDIEGEIYPDLKDAFGTTPQSALWSDILPDGKHALRLTFRGDEMTRRPANIVVMGTRASVLYPPRRQPKAPLCQRCWRQHPTRKCTQEGRTCRICGSGEHTGPHHPSNEAAHCVNCGGPHSADSPTCLKALEAKDKRPLQRPQASQEIETEVSEPTATNATQGLNDGNNTTHNSSASW